MRVNTRNLEIVFSTLLGRYKIITDVPEGKVNSDIIKDTLETLLARTHKVVICKTERETARDVFDKLSNELREVLKENNEEKNRKSILFLLGALLHRYFRLIKEYDTFNSYIPVPRFFFKYKPPSDVKDCRLFQAIRLALGLPALMGENYQADDLKILDVTTIVTALETFRDNMLMVDKDKEARYKSYPHFATDKNFKTYLQDIIDEHKRRGPSVLKQFKAIGFMRSLVNKMEEECQLIKEALNSLSKLMQRNSLEFKTLSIELLEEQIRTHIKSEDLQENIVDLLYTPHIKSKLGELDHESFIKEMKICNYSSASYKILGGFSLLLQHEGIEEKLRFCIYQALGLGINSDELTDKDMLDGVKFLKKYFDDNPKVELNFDFFGGREPMNTFILQTELALTKKVQEQKKSQEKEQEPSTSSLVV